MGNYKHKTETIDATTGEVQTITKSYSIKKKKSEDFFFVFLSGLNAIISLTRPSDIKILTCLCDKAEFNTGRVKLTPTDREEITKKLNIKSQAFSNSLTRLRKSGLVEGTKGEYVVNPQCFWKGTTDERERLLKEKSFNLNLKYEYVQDTK